MRRSPQLIVLSLLAVIGIACVSSVTTRPAHSAPDAARTETVALPSSALGSEERVIVHLPPGYAPQRRYPLVIFLHGTPGKPEDFVAHGVPGRIDALVRAGRLRPFVAAFPVGGDNAEDDNEWADGVRGNSPRWETFVTHDVIAALQHRYSLIEARAGRAVAGISMGGYGAMNLALRHRGRFAAVSSWSGYFTGNTPSVHPIGSAAWRRNSPALYAAGLRPSLRSSHPAISFSVGAEDRFAAENRAFDRLLTRLGVPHDFRVVAHAGHNWRLWSSQLDRELVQLGRQLAPAR